MSNPQDSASFATTALWSWVHFVSRSQFHTLLSLQASEEGAWFKEVAVAMAQRIERMPATYETHGQGETAVVHLHYFCGGCDWYITEKDIDGGIDQAFGLAILNGDTANAESGYISIREIVRCGAEMDLHWGLKTLAEVKRDKGIDH